MTDRSRGNTRCSSQKHEYGECTQRSTISTRLANESTVSRFCSVPNTHIDQTARDKRNEKEEENKIYTSWSYTSGSELVSARRYT